MSLVTGAPRALVGPLVESLKHEMIAHDHRLADLAGLEPTPVRDAIGGAVAEDRARLPWFIYILTQAHFHASVMAAFRRHLARIEQRDRPETRE